jgi:hypothetical protein
MRNALFHTLLVFLILNFGSHVVQAQTANEAHPNLSAAHPDWTGFYTLASKRDLAGTGFQSDAPGEQLNGLITPYLQPWAKARMEATDGIADDTGQVCLPDGIFRYPSMAGLFQWLQGRGRIILVFSNINTAGVRRIFMDRPHPKNPIPTWNGDSIGRWEGETLLVDTVGFNDKSWLFGGKQPHTEEAHLIERVRRVGNGALLEMTITVEDRHALTSAYSYKRYYKKQSSDEMPEEVCNEDAETWKAFRDAALKKQLDSAKVVK